MPFPARSWWTKLMPTLPKPTACDWSSKTKRYLSRGHSAKRTPWPGCGLAMWWPNLQMIEQLAKVKDSYNCDALSIAGATAAIDDQAWLADPPEHPRLAARLIAQLQQLGFHCTLSQANFVWCQHPAIRPQELYQQLKADGVLVRLTWTTRVGNPACVSALAPTSKRTPC